MYTKFIEVKDMEKEKKKPKFIHIMADGSIRDSVKGYEVPEDNLSYLLMAKMICRSCERDKVAQNQGDSQP